MTHGTTLGIKRTAAVLSAAVVSSIVFGAFPAAAQSVTMVGTPFPSDSANILSSYQQDYNAIWKGLDGRAALSLFSYPFSYDTTNGANASWNGYSTMGRFYMAPQSSTVAVPATGYASAYSRYTLPFYQDSFLATSSLPLPPNMILFGSSGSLQPTVTSTSEPGVGGFEAYFYTGNSLTINGSNFDVNAKVYLDGGLASTTTTVNSSGTQMTIALPVDMSTGTFYSTFGNPTGITYKLTVHDKGLISNEVPLTILPQPVSSQAVPTFSSINSFDNNGNAVNIYPGGIAVIHGSNIARGAAVQFRQAGSNSIPSATILYNDGSLMYIQVPNLSNVTKYTVTIANAGVQNNCGTVFAGACAYLSATTNTATATTFPSPTVTSTSETSAGNGQMYAGGMAVIQGTNFVPSAVKVEFLSNGQSVAQASLLYTTPTRIYIKVPGSLAIGQYSLFVQNTGAAYNYAGGMPISIVGTTASALPLLSPDNQTTINNSAVVAASTPSILTIPTTQNTSQQVAQGTKAYIQTYTANPSAYQNQPYSSGNALPSFAGGISILRTRNIVSVQNIATDTTHVTLSDTLRVDQQAYSATFKRQLIDRGSQVNHVYYSADYNSSALTPSGYHWFITCSPTSYQLSSMQAQIGTDTSPSGCIAVVDYNTTCSGGVCVPTVIYDPLVQFSRNGDYYSYTDAPWSPPVLAEASRETGTLVQNTATSTIPVSDNIVAMGDPQCDTTVNCQGTGCFQTSTVQYCTVYATSADGRIGTAKSIQSSLSCGGNFLCSGITLVGNLTLYVISSPLILMDWLVGDPSAAVQQGLSIASIANSTSGYIGAVATPGASVYGTVRYPEPYTSTSTVPWTWTWGTSPIFNSATCTNGATDYPSCTACANGGTPVNGVCPVCTNGAADYPTCTACPLGQGWDTTTSSCSACLNGGCTSTNTSTTGGTQSNPTGGLTCNDGATNPLSCDAYAPTISFGASPSQVNPGDTITFTWSATASGSYPPKSCSAVNSAFNTQNKTSGTATAKAPSSGGFGNNVTYGITCTNTRGDSSTAYTSVKLLVPDLSIAASPSRLQSGQRTYLTWSSKNIQAGSCNVSGTDGFSYRADNATNIVDRYPITSQVTYTLSCYKPGGWGSPGTRESVSTVVQIVPQFNQF